MNYRCSKCSFSSNQVNAMAEHARRVHGRRYEPDTPQGSSTLSDVVIDIIEAIADSFDGGGGTFGGGGASGDW